MELTLALVADYANVSDQGTLNVLGIFDTIFAPAFPTLHNEMHLVLRFESGPAERGLTKTVEIKLIDPDGQVVAHLGQDISLPRESPTLVSRFNQIIRMQHLRFERPGDYRFDILVNGETKGNGAPFQLVAAPLSAEPPGESSERG
jgi:hypothetical protein